jgi:hypothetical protein
MIRLLGSLIPIPYSLSVASSCRFGYVTMKLTMWTDSKEEFLLNIKDYEYYITKDNRLMDRIEFEGYNYDERIMNIISQRIIGLWIVLNLKAITMMNAPR